MGFTKKLCDDKISVGGDTIYDSFTVRLRKYNVGIHVHILHLQILSNDNLQNDEFNLEKQVQIINWFALILLFLFHERLKLLIL